MSNFRSAIAFPATTSVRLAAAVSGAAVLGAVIAGCSTDSAPTAAESASSSTTSSASAATGTHNAADVMFNQMMIPHHRQAVEMADMVDSRTGNAQLRKLAAQIKAAQQPEIDQMTARLKSWNEPTEMPGSGHGGHRMSGMMSDAEMTKLEAARNADFDRMWLEMMIAHHQGAVEMADTEIAQGADPASKQLAEQIKSTQQAEIAQMNTMLGR